MNEKSTATMVDLRAFWETLDAKTMSNNFTSMPEDCRSNSRNDDWDDDCCCCVGGYSK